ncbi:3-oxoacyl-[acyl-carrier-protein] reductase [bacterium]|nr:3-oxoacyl-[acyl-carrier-protein] reductase [bacterium]
MKRLEGKTALITGGAQGIGMVIAQRFVSEGAQIALCDINPETAERTAQVLSGEGGIVKAFVMNVANEESVNSAIKSIADEFGKIDILINNAGITRDNLMLRMKTEDWNAVISVNLTGTFLVSRAVIKMMLKAHYGRIINIASVVGVVGNPGQVNYSASKAGIIGMTKTMAKEFASRSVTVNAIAPGFIQTEMTEHLPQEAKDAFLTVIPLNRPGLPEDVAGAAVFLASDDAAYITGQVICVDGGMVM